MKLPGIFNGCWGWACSFALKINTRGIWSVCLLMFIPFSSWPRLYIYIRKVMIATTGLITAQLPGMYYVHTMSLPRQEGLANKCSMS